MKEYEKPWLELIYINSDVITESCPDDTYECDIETPGFCIGANS